MEALWRFIERLCEKVWQVLIGALVYMFNAIAPNTRHTDGLHDYIRRELFTGLFAGVLVQHEGFIFRKAFKCISEAAVISGLMAMILLVGDNIDNHDGAMSAISLAVYALIYFYGVNILKNLNRIFPKNRYIDFLYYVLSFEMIRRFPIWKTTTKQRTNEKEMDRMEHRCGRGRSARNRIPALHPRGGLFVLWPDGSGISCTLNTSRNDTRAQKQQPAQHREDTGRQSLAGRGRAVERQAFRAVYDGGIRLSSCLQAVEQLPA
mgnify:CR=1 FL=1